MAQAFESTGTWAFGDPPALIVQVPAALQMDDDQLFEFAAINRELRIERTANGELIIMPPTGSETGRSNIKISTQLENWSDKDGRGLAFDSSTGFTLANSAMRSPDASWLFKSRWDALSPEERKKFAPVCPDSVIELRSESDSLRTLKEKMQEYLDNGAQLGWLIDPLEHRAYIYRPGQPVEVLDKPDSLSGDPLLPGFVLDLRPVW